MSEMIGVVATVPVRPDKADEFERVSRELAAKVKANEPGCLLYEMTRSRNTASTYVGLEIYRDQAALDQHIAADYFQLALGRLQPCLDGEARVEFLDGLD